MINVTIRILTLILCSFIAGCLNNQTGSALDDSPEAATVLSSTGAWQLKQYSGLDGSLTSASQKTPYQLKFNQSSGTLSSYINCQSLNDGTYELFDGYVSVQMGSNANSDDCSASTSAALDNQKKAVMDIIAPVVEMRVDLTIDLSANELKMLANDGRTLVFEPVESLHAGNSSGTLNFLEQNQWNVIEFTDESGSITDIPLEAGWLWQFNPNNTSGYSTITQYYGPCNFREIKYVRTSTGIKTIGYVDIDGPVCTEEAQIVLDIEFTRIAALVVNDDNEFTIKQENPDKPELVIHSKNGETFKVSTADHQ